MWNNWSKTLNKNDFCYQCFMYITDVLLGKLRIIEKMDKPFSLPKIINVNKKRMQCLIKKAKKVWKLNINKH